MKFALAILLAGKDKLQVHITDEAGAKSRILPADDLINS